MPEITYEDVIPSPVENTSVRFMLSDGVRRTYNISANEGYVLHDKSLDYNDPETDELILGFSQGTKSCGINYDWEANPREFYAVLRTEVPENQIFGGGESKPEVM